MYKLLIIERKMISAKYDGKRIKYWFYRKKYEKEKRKYEREAVRNRSTNKTYKN